MLSKGDDVVPIPGTKRRKYLEENTASVAVTLTPAEVTEIETAVPSSAVAGTRYAEAGLKAIDR